MNLGVQTLGTLDLRSHDFVVHAEKIGIFQIMLRHWRMFAWLQRFHDFVRKKAIMLRHWRHLLSRKTIQLRSSTVYSVVQLTQDNIDALLQYNGMDMNSQWHGQIDSVTTILRSHCLKPFYKTANQDLRNGFLAVLPCQKGPNELVAVYAELRDCIYDFLASIRWGMLSDLSRSNEPSDPEDPAPNPILFVVPRVSGLSGRKLRKIALNQFLQVIEEGFILQNPRNENTICALVMYRLDFEQTGLFSIAEPEIRATGGFVTVKVVWSKFQKYVKDIGKMDELLCDLLILSNDLGLHQYFGFKLNLRGIERDLIISNKRAIDSDKLKSAIIQAYTCTNGPRDHHRTVEEVERHTNGPRDHHRTVEEVERHTLEIQSIVKEVISYSLDGVSSDHPCQIVYDFEFALELLKKRNDQYKIFRRQVKSISKSGYRVRHFNVAIWIGLNVGIVLPFVYFGIRARKACFEDLIQTAVSLVALYIAIIPPILFQFIYKGESFSDVLSNIRNIDTQEEFDERKNSIQLTNTLEVIWRARRPPQFFGGRNMSYLTLGKQDGLVLDAKEPISFQNLEHAGFALYEDEKGEMYMLDKWSNLFEVFLGILVKDAGPEESEVTGDDTIEGDNPYIGNEREETSPNNANTYLNMSIYCKSIKQKRDPNILQDKGCFSVKSDIFQVPNGVKEISRLLPYGYRKRKVEIRRWRLRTLRVKWVQVPNAKILEMDIGRSFSDDH